MSDHTSPIDSFLDALDRQDGTAIASLLSAEVAYDPGFGDRIIGASAVRDTLIERATALKERHGDRLFLASDDGSRVAAEVTLRGIYDMSLPQFGPAEGQSYSVPAVLVAEMEGGRISRLSRYLDQDRFHAALGED
ncbi:nuclear transport factor 2 family protein [Pararhizobium haloflavum]|uniref:nuclear transport factor 2 family protein n=1 Tax=Pararhizobium haloflavum TaxID=2037914 RepID=UPI0012FFF37E|nr:nuclear transport factor 2 family protein [Pararhizobium haloflavum]